MDFVNSTAVVRHKSHDPDLSQTHVLALLQNLMTRFDSISLLFFLKVIYLCYEIRLQNIARLHSAVVMLCGKWVKMYGAFSIQFL